MNRINPKSLFDSRKYGYSQITKISAQTMTFISGQFSSSVEGEVIGTTLIEQITHSFRNLKIAIKESGASPDDVAKIQILIVGHTEEDLVHLVKESEALFGNKCPASILIPVPRLGLEDMLFEIDATILTST